RFRRLKTCEEEETCVAGAIPKSTRYKNKWAAGIFDNLQRARFPKVPINYDLHKIQSSEVSLVQMGALSLNYWLT
ncbi:unnamed protein product, partial [Porites evermanni]